MANGYLILTPVMSAERMRQVVDGECEVARIAVPKSRRGICHRAWERTPSAMFLTPFRQGREAMDIASLQAILRKRLGMHQRNERT